MTTERMLELLLICRIYDSANNEDLIHSGYDYEALENRSTELMTEFLEPYVIDNTPRGE